MGQSENFSEDSLAVLR